MKRIGNSGADRQELVVSAPMDAGACAGLTGR
jgi:hypothetical protein